MPFTSRLAHCTVCDLEDSLAEGPPEREALYWLRKAVTTLHLGRQALELAGLKLEAGAGVSENIRAVEATIDRVEALIRG